MKSVLAVILLSVYGVAVVKPVLPLIDYYVAMEVYLEQCINKARPELHCNGQCILMQKLKAFNGEAKTPQAPAPVKINLQDFPIGFIESLALEIQLSDPDQSVRRHFSSALTEAYSAEFFHPPTSTV